MNDHEFSRLPSFRDALLWLDMILKANRTQIGYDSEELYFEKLNRELIEKLHKNPDHKSSAVDSPEAAPFQGESQVLQFTARPKAPVKKAA